MPGQYVTAKQPGQAMILAVLTMTIMLIFAGLAIDGAKAFNERRNVFNAADAAVMAATRELINQQQLGGSATSIAVIIDDYLERHGLDAANTTWTAAYVQRLAPDTPVQTFVAAAPVPGNVDGLQLNVSYSFDTDFIGAFGFEQFTVGGTATAMFGPLGTAIGSDLVPLAITDSGLETIIAMDDQNDSFRLDLQGNIVDDAIQTALINGTLPVIPEDVIQAGDIAHISFRETASTPQTGIFADCQTPGDPSAQTLNSWWCNGSPAKLRIGRELPSSTPVFALLNGAIDERINERPTALLPVFAYEPSGLRLINFVAVTLESRNPDGSITARLLRDYATSGAMIGDGSGVSTGVQAVNLIR